MNLQNCLIALLLLFTCGCASVRVPQSEGEKRLEIALNTLKSHNKYPFDGDYDLNVRRAEEYKMWMFCFWPKPGSPGGDLNVWIHDDGKVEYVRLP